MVAQVRSSELVELLAGAAVSLFVEDPARALTWIPALQAAWDASDPAQVIALAAQVDLREAEQAIREQALARRRMKARA